MLNEPIYVTRPFMPSLDEFEPYLKEIWQSKWLTNQGPFHDKLEQALCAYLGVKHISLFANGTLALITALQALEIKGEVITTPFSFVATTHALWWNGITPVFSDIEENNCNLDPNKIEASITEKTSAILPVHVYGNPCDIESIQQIADRNKLKVIYDAAHAFGVKYKGSSICNAGDLSILSFHATKIFNTFEGGAIVCHTLEMKQKIDYLKNFGFADEVTVVRPGINAKMNEFQAAFGLLHLKYMNKIILERKSISELYKKNLKQIKGVHVFNETPLAEFNYSYFPILIDTLEYGLERDELYNLLKENNIFTRRYFYPLISSFAPYNSFPGANPSFLPVAHVIAKKVLCLPTFSGLAEDDICMICSIISNAQKA
jgi:dTDP-4-amino-4,6-dideoxygalactose transaminase